MTRPIALAPITTPELAPPDTVAVAARTGYSHVGLRLQPSTPEGFAWPLASDAALLRETQMRLRDTGIGVLDIDIIRLHPATDPVQYKPMLETGQALGARCVLTMADDADAARLAANFATVCDLASPCGLTIDLEFMPWSSIHDLDAALALLRSVDRPNAGILIDPLHVDRCEVSIAELARLPRRWLHYMQICDGPAERPATMAALIHCGRFERLFPGEGALDLPGMLRALPDDLPISVEVPKQALSRMVGPEQRARMALDATQAVLRTLPAPQGG